MNIHINKHTRFQAWEGKTIFNEYPVHIRSGNFTVTLLFHDCDSMEKLRQVLTDTLFEIESNIFKEQVISSLPSVKSKRL